MKTYTEQKLKALVTPDIIKEMVKLAEGFGYIECEDNYFSISVNKSEYGNIITDEILFPLLIHRAVEKITCLEFNYESKYIYCYKTGKVYHFKNYQPENLTQCECACLHCLIEIFKSKLNLNKSKLNLKEK